MIPKYKQRSYILDVLQRGVVNICMSITVIAAGCIVYQGFYYYKYVKPAMKEAKLLSVEELLQEGKYDAPN